MPLDLTPTLAAVKYEAGSDINRLIPEVVTDLQARGRLIGGVLQEFEARGDPSCLRLKVVDVRTRKAASITQDRGRDAQGCKLDPSGLADISHCITDAIAARVDLMVINKFGRAESEGSGLVSALRIRSLPVFPSSRPCESPISMPGARSMAAWGSSSRRASVRSSRGATPPAAR